MSTLATHLRETITCLKLVAILIIGIVIAIMCFGHQLGALFNTYHHSERNFCYISQLALQHLCERSRDVLTIFCLGYA